MRVVIREVTFPRSGNDVWLELECGHYVRKVGEHKCPCEMAGIPSPRTVKRAKKELIEAARRRKAKRKAEEKEKKEVEKALKVLNKAGVQTKLPQGHFYWRGKVRQG